MEAFLVSVAVVALGEIGDKTQLLALMLAARFRRPWPIVAGILVATLVTTRSRVSSETGFAPSFPPDVLRWLARAVVLRRGRVGAQAGQARRRRAPPTSRLGVFGVTVVAFFLAEMGDKTQIATVVLAARFDALAAVVAGTTLGMLLATCRSCSPASSPPSASRSRPSESPRRCCSPRSAPGCCYAGTAGELKRERAAPV